METSGEGRHGSFVLPFFFFFFLNCLLCSGSFGHLEGETKNFRGKANRQIRVARIENFTKFRCLAKAFGVVWNRS